MKNIYKFLVSFLISLTLASPCFAEDSLDGNYVTACSDLEIIFARGSGGKINETEEFKAVVGAAQEIADEYYLGSFTIDLDYPAVDVSNVGRLVGAYVSAGKSYEFGDSVKAGVRNLQARYLSRSKECPDMGFILVGYSQGAMVISQALSSFDAERVKFVMLLGDPNTYLPEGEGLFPAACSGGSLSSYRTFAPNCRTYEGVFGGRKPYELAGLTGKYSLWCNSEDYICGSSKNPLKNSGHTAYAKHIGSGMRYLARKYLDKYVPSEIRPFSLRSVALSNRLDDNPLIDSQIGANIEAPSDVAVWREGDVLKMKWSAPEAAKDLLLRFDDIDLGYLDASRSEFEIRDVDFARDYKLSLAWMDATGELGDIMRVTEDDVLDEAPAAADIVPEFPVASIPAIDSPSPIASVTENVSGYVTPVLETPSIAPASRGVVALPAKAKTVNGFTFAEKSQIVAVIFSMLGASGMLAVFILRKRRG